MTWNWLIDIGIFLGAVLGVIQLLEYLKKADSALQLRPWVRWWHEYIVCFIAAAIMASILVALGWPDTIIIFCSVLAGILSIFLLSTKRPVEDMVELGESRESTNGNHAIAITEDGNGGISANYSSGRIVSVNKKGWIVFEVADNTHVEYNTRRITVQGTRDRFNWDWFDLAPNFFSLSPQPYRSDLAEIYYIRIRKRK